jgi:hypothetical protein
VTSARIEMTDVKRGLKELQKLEPELRRQIRLEAEQIAKPAIEETRQAYRMVPLSGMERKWDDVRGRRNTGGRQVFPFKVNKAQSGVRFRFDTRRNALGVLKIEQRDRAAAVFETAGRKHDNSFSDQLNEYSSRGWAIVPDEPTRIFGPAAYRAARKGVTEELRRLILRVSRMVERHI